MTRNKKSAVGRSFTQKPTDLRDSGKGLNGPIVSRVLTAEELAERRAKAKR